MFCLHIWKAVRFVLNKWIYCEFLREKYNRSSTTHKDIVKNKISYSRIACRIEKGSTLLRLNLYIPSILLVHLSFYLYVQFVGNLDYPCMFASEYHIYAYFHVRQECREVIGNGC